MTGLLFGAVSLSILVDLQGTGQQPDRHVLVGGKQEGP